MRNKRDSNNCQVRKCSTKEKKLPNSSFLCECHATSGPSVLDLWSGENESNVTLMWEWVEMAERKVIGSRQVVWTQRNSHHIAWGFQVLSTGNLLLGLFKTLTASLFSKSQGEQKALTEEIWTISRDCKVLENRLNSWRSGTFQFSTYHSKWKERELGK